MNTELQIEYSNMLDSSYKLFANKLVLNKELMDKEGLTEEQAIKQIELELQSKSIDELSDAEMRMALLLARKENSRLQKELDKRQFSFNQTESGVSVNFDDNKMRNLELENRRVSRMFEEQEKELAHFKQESLILSGKVNCQSEELYKLRERLSVSENALTAIKAVIALDTRNEDEDDD
ncbi:hypothetical protein [Idiomarina piscisalsi]|uniref:Uncharacterized protein n=1 Tax=Idiomarina piscisalsi TaxID=1096243 RepID=A0A432YXE5_9GAMM|nr:hypothetical protein [Idiomarina piscisalsi]RUO68004.1 hypothetical protein CWI73_03870 [Idiomarina piscisalsi]